MDWPGVPERPVSGARLLISIVVPCCDEEEVLGALHVRFCDLADFLNEQDGYGTELVLVDDGSRDATWASICELAGRDSRVRGIRLSRNFGHQAAVGCGYDHARGDAIVSLDADLQDPPEVVPDMVRAWREGADVVFGVRESRTGDSCFKRGTAWLFYWLMHRLGAHGVRRNVGDFRLLSRRARDAMTEVSGSRPFFREAAGWIGFRSAEIKYARQPRRRGATKFTFGRMCKLASEALVSSSMRPLYFSWCAAAFVAVLAVGLLLVAAWFPVLSPGRAAIIPVVAILLCAGLVLFGQGIQGLYLARIHEECRARPLYLVAERVSRLSDREMQSHEDMASCLRDK